MKRIVARPEELARKVAQLVKDGPASLHVIADFDSTMTAQDSMTSWSLLKKSTRLSEAYQELSSSLFAKYHPREIDESLPIADRTKFMDEWWNAAHKALLEEQLTVEDFRTMVSGTMGEHLHFREQTDELLKRCKYLNVPFLVFSAGLGDLIDAALEREGWSELAHVLSNHLRFDAANGGIASGFTRPNIHTFSKQEAQLRNLHEDWAKDVSEQRRNVIVIGDSIGDCHMAAGVEHDLVLRIGFLNRGRESSLEEYRAGFDIVLQDDDSMAYLLEILSELK